MLLDIVGIIYKNSKISKLLVLQEKQLTKLLVEI